MRVLILNHYGSFAYSSWVLNNYTERTNLPRDVKPHTKVFLDYLFKSRAPSTSKRYLQEIKKFFQWIMAHFGRVIIPVTDLIAAVYLYNRTTSSASSSRLVLLSLMRLLNGYIHSYPTIYTILWTLR